MLPLDLKAFGVAAGWDSLPEAVASRNFQRTATDPVFPGAILPAIAADGTVYWYGAAAAAADWRRLQPLLLAYAGPTVTLFTGQMVDPDIAVPAERLLQAAGIQAMARLVPGRDCLRFATSALDRLCQAVALRPITTRAVPEPTSRLLARLDMCLAAGDRKAAEDLLEMLRAELRLDTLNLHFVEVRILSSFRAWRELVDAEWFPELCLARKPAACARAMLEGLWHAHLAELANDEAQLRRYYRNAVQPLARPLLGQVSDETDELVQRLRALDESRPSSLPVEAEAQDLLDRAADAPSNLHLAQARSAIDALPKQARETLLQSGAGQQAVAEIGSLDIPLPTGWRDWLDALGDPRFVTAVAVAREGITQWPAQGFATTEQAASLADSLLQIGVSGGLGGSRLVESLPSLVRWVKEDAEYPRPILAAVYESLLQLFDLLERRGGAERDAAADLFEAILSLGITKDSYRRLLSDFGKLIEEGAGTSSIYWLIDLASILLEHPTPDLNARLVLLNRILGSFQPLLGLLSPGQRASYNRIATGASWPALPTPVGSAAPGALGRLGGQSVAIYTLTESAGRQAETVLKELIPSLRVELAHDHVASSRLARLARDADIFVMSAASAKHAATDCIVANRGAQPLLYAAGRGFSSIVRAIEEYGLRKSSQ
jgi:hypothetical protein